MRKIPNIVRSRLARKAADTPTAHPDPNLLAAFAEHSLGVRERSSVTAHLAECADCRESLALAFGAREPELSPAAPPLSGWSFGAWLRRWRWVATAAVACGVLAVALQYRLGQRNDITTKYQEIASLQKSPSPQAAPDTPTPSALITPVPSAPKRLRRASKTEPQGPQVRYERLPAPEQSAAAPKENAEALRQNVPAVGENSATVYAPTADATSAFMQSRDVGASSKNGLGTADKLKAETRQMVIPRRALAKMSAEPGVRWSINASPGTVGHPYGVVQRSSDRGRTWESVSLNEGVNFRAVAASGDDVWAGGSGGVLFHSPDGGLNWVEVTLGGENSSFTGAIVSIDARDPSQLIITTSSRERWISRDRGRHWTRE